MFKCPNCNGALYYDIRKKVLKCQHCQSEVPVADYHTDNAAVLEDMSVYTCSNCGAQLISPDQSAVAFCSYCGSEQILEEKLAKELNPKEIIPFRLTKESCIKRYQKAIKGKLYVPREFRNTKFLEKFRGIYIPYWRMETGFTDQPLSFEGYASYRSGDYYHYETFKLQANLENTVVSMPYDASSNFDDTIADSIAPYKKADVQEFYPGYLAGFCADTADVSPDTYSKIAEEEAIETATEQITKSFQKTRNVTPRLPGKKKAKEFLQPRLIGTPALLLPVWFLTWRKNRRVAYMVVNGQTGRVSAELPVSYLSFFGCTLAAAAVLYGIMTLLVSMTAPTALLISMTISTVALILYQQQIKKIHDKETHVFDRGYFIEGRDTEISEAKAERIRRRRERGFWAGKIGAVFVILMLLEVCVYWLSDSMPDETAQLASVFLFPVIVYNVLRTLTFVKNVKEKSMLIDVLFGTAGIAFGYYVLFTLQAHDYMYYIGCILCILGVLVTCIGLIRKYNVLATRPLPSFFDRTGGDVHEG